MFEYNIDVNHSYSVYIFVIGKKEYKIRYKKRIWIKLKNKIKSFFSNLFFNIKFYKLKKQQKELINKNE